MQRRRGHLALRRGAPALLGLVLLACHEPPPDACEPVYGGSASDEAWRTMFDGESRAEVDPVQSPMISTPTEGQAYAAADPAPRLTWTSTLALAPTRRGGAPTRWARAVDWLAGVVERRAEAHLPPITGAVYFIHFDIAGRACPYNVLTTETSWQVDADAWAAMKAASAQPISVRMTGAYLTENRISEGPFRLAAPRTFTVR